MKKIFVLLVTLLLFLGVFYQSANQLVKVNAQTEFTYHFPIFVNTDPRYAIFSSIGPDGGTVTNVTVDPRNSNRIFAGTWGNGIYKSVDGGNTWVAKNFGLQSGFIFDIAIDPSNSAHVLATIYHYGIYESMDGGESWWPTSGFPEGCVAYSIVFDPQSPRTVYAGVRLQTIYSPEVLYPGGVYKSTNGGKDWVNKSSNLPQDYIYDIAIDPNNSERLYVALHRFGVYKSLDGAENWKSSNYNIHYRDVRSVDFNPNNSDLYAGMYDGKGVAFLKYGTETWSVIDSTIDQGLYVYHLLVDPINPENLYLATSSGLYRCIGDPYPNYGTDCAQIAHADAFVFDFALDLKSTDASGDITKMYSAVANLGLFKSKDAGNTFAPSYNGIKSNNIVSILNDPDQPAVLYASAYERGVFKSVNEGQTWSRLGNGLSSRLVNQLVFRPGDPAVIYAATEDEGIFISTDRGSSWQPLNSGLPTSTALSSDQGVDSQLSTPNPLSVFEGMDPVDFEAMQFDVSERQGFIQSGTYPPILSITIDPANPSKMIAGTEAFGILKSDDYGMNWTSTNLDYGSVYDAIVDNSQPVYTFFAGVSADGIKASDSERTAWPAMNTGLPDVVDVFSLARAASGRYFAASDDGIFKTNTAGESWQSVGLGGIQINDVWTTPTDPGVVWAASSEGLFRSLDGGNHWIQLGRENLNDQFLTVAQGFGSSSIYFGMNGGNIYHFAP